MTMMMTMSCFCGMVDRRKAFILITIRDHCQRSSPSRIFDTLRARFEPARNGYSEKNSQMLQYLLQLNGKSKEKNYPANIFLFKVNNRKLA